MKAGTQFVFVPTHAKRDIAHPDCRRGFVASDHRLGQSVFVYFWEELGITLRRNEPVLTDSSRLVIVDSVEQGVVDALLVLQAT